MSGNFISHESIAGSFVFPHIRKSGEMKIKVQNGEEGIIAPVSKHYNLAKVLKATVCFTLQKA